MLLRHRAKFEFGVRREKGARILWEEGIPPGNCCSNRKQPEWLGPVTARVEALGVKGPERGSASRQVET
jgi:hypothetical protein